MESERGNIERRIEELALKLRQPEPGLQGEEVTRRARKRIFQAIGKLKRRLDSLNNANPGIEDQHSQSASDSESNGPVKRPKLAAADNSEVRQPIVEEVQTSSQDPAPRKLLKARLKLLNDELSSLARSKQAKQAEKRIAWGIRKGIPVDVHSYTNLMNAHVRCGNINRAKEIIGIMRDRRIHPNTVTLTTLIKGLCEHGLVKEALEMMEEAPLDMRPNVRTVSTVLRGCLRVGDAKSATSIYESMVSKWNLKPDKTCVEYLVAMLCQSMRIPEAEGIVASHMLIGASSAAKSQASTVPQIEYDPLSNAVVFLSLARACSVLADWDRASSYCECATKALAELLQKSKKKMAEGSGELAASGAGGAKRSGVAEASAHMFEEHSREAAARDLDSIRKYQHLSRSKLADAQINAINAFSRLLHFKEGHSTNEGILENLKSSYGFERLCRSASTRSPELWDVASRKVLESLVRRNEETVINFDAIFSHVQANAKGIFELRTRKLDLPIKLEIGSGMGEWVCDQAVADAGRAFWVAMELRSDRSYNILSRSMFANNIDNLAVICGDAHQVIARQFPEGRISQAFINHPQPPDRTDRGKHGQSSDGKHLLTLEFFRILHEALIPGGTVTIVTDNQQYAHQLLDQFNEGLATLYQDKRVADIDTTAKQSQALDSDSVSVRLHRVGSRSLGGPLPLERFGHVADASSYFDRLWNRGDKTQRWVLYVETRA